MMIVSYLSFPRIRRLEPTTCNVAANQFSLNRAKITLQHDPDPTGFRVDLGFGRAFDIIHASRNCEFKAREGVPIRLEYRHDWANVPLFDHGNNPFANKNQTTLVAGFAAFFGPKR